MPAPTSRCRVTLPSASATRATTEYPAFVADSTNPAAPGVTAAGSAASSVSLEPAAPAWYVIVTPPTPGAPPTTSDTAGAPSANA